MNEYHEALLAAKKVFDAWLMSEESEDTDFGEWLELELEELGTEYE